jgi:hypothetical protein
MTETELLEHHYRYELSMLMETHARIGGHEDTVIENALIESFCIHARALMEFFSDSKGARKYTGCKYIPLSKRGPVEKLIRLLNTQIAHLINEGLTSDFRGKISAAKRDELVGILEKKSQEFQNSLRSEYRGLKVPVMRRIGSATTGTSSSAPSEVKVPPPLEPSAANATSGATASISSNFIIIPTSIPPFQERKAMSDLYDEDFVLWTERQATLLRRRAAGDLVNDAELDWQNLAEEIEAVGGNTRRELRNRLARLLQHLLKWHYQPELRSRSWRATIRTQRQEIEDLLADNPSLRARLPEFVAAAYPRARAAAMDETGLLDLPEESPFTTEHTLTAELPEQ